ncbi:MAG: polyphenol oxidase family protein, partial [Balneolaceae bacterium]
LILGIQVADCAAILLSDPENHIIGASHAGWRGAAAGIVMKTISMMISAGARPDRMIAFISPCISQEKFEVGPEVAEQFPDEYVDSKSFKKPHVDLKGFIKHQLLRTGIPDKQIETSELCTYLDRDKFYSFRRERHRAGRMLGMIRLNQ